jgi:membrane-associated phospholipid phosphatase
MRDRIIKAVLRYISIYLILGLTISSLCLWLFAALARQVLAGAPITAIDQALANALHARATPLGTAVYRIVTAFGGSWIIVIAIAVGLFFLVRRRWSYLAVWIIALVGGGLLSMQMKTIFARPRPVFTNPLLIEQSFSFPSAHAMTSLITYGILAYFLWHEVHNRIVRILIVFAAVLLVVLVGISRMTLGVHYLSDVLGGFIAGGIWLGMCIAALSILHRGEARLAMIDEEESTLPPSEVRAPTT